MSPSTLTREAVVAGLVGLVGADKVVTDPEELRRSSVDRFRKYEDICGVWTQPPPAAVVMATSTADVAAVLAFADAHGVNVVPRTGRSATEGGLETVVPDSVVLDGSGMKDVLSVDEVNMQVTVQCGVGLQELDDLLRVRGWTTGHSPQSKPLAQLGGLVATRSIGQLSTLYGGIEDMVVGLEVVFPDGTVSRIKNVPRRAAGPDIRHVVIGNEGALCFVTEVTVKIFPYRPENNRYLGWTLDSMAEGFAVLREVMAQGLRPSVARLYDGPDGAQHFSHFAEPLECTLVFVTEGHAAIADATATAIADIVAARGTCRPVDGAVIEAWFDRLNWGPEQVAAERVEIAETKSIGFTTEVSAGWSAIHDIYVEARFRILAEIEGIEMVGGHSSHSYVNGTNMYFVYYYNVGDCPPEEEITRFHTPINAIICEETLRFGGSIVHHHGVGKHRTAWIEDEHGSAWPMLARLKQAFDPNGIMNAGTIWPRPLG
ncbi:FAD-binding oxidoreductase [Kineosporia sp. A_224]|uniref:FAD-binding oxidoreductase n=1 Tax=Kineosporia sp. A_224 TaxID=1962180 RepID=UPI000B4C1321|nr:FAD-binding oxidoreductase [Kineosporia sp. A_224]